VPPDTICNEVTDYDTGHVSNNVSGLEFECINDGLQNLENHSEHHQAAAHGKLKKFMGRGKAKTDRNQRKTEQVDSCVAERYQGDGLFEGIGRIQGKIDDHGRGGETEKSPESDIVAEREGGLLLRVQEILATVFIAGESITSTEKTGNFARIGMLCHNGQARTARAVAVMWCP
jgi:hypothetical protein